MLTWEQDGFALAESFDDAEARYRGLHCMESITLNDAEWTWLVVRAEVARQQRNAELARLKDEESRVKEEPDEELKDDTGGGTGGSGGEPKPPEPEPRAAQPKRFHGTIELNATRVGRDASRVAEEVISHLTGLVGAKVKITLEIEAEVPSGVPDQVVRIVTENSRTLKFTTQGFEKE